MSATKDRDALYTKSVDQQIKNDRLQEALKLSQALLAANKILVSKLDYQLKVFLKENTRLESLVQEFKLNK